MPEYALLLRPSGNRVYSTTAAMLAVAEAGALLAATGEAAAYRVEPGERAGVAYLSVDGPPLDAVALGRLSLLSNAYALFEVAAGGLLRPLALDDPEVYDDDLATIPKYRGKTNEQFTRLLLNLTATTSDAAGRLRDAPLRVLDPMCGRGTTLNQALLYGWDAIGVEQERAEVDAYALFMRTWLERRRLKHRWSYEPVRRNRTVIARRLDVETATDRDSWRDGPRQRLQVWQADTRVMREHVGAAAADLLVCDLPYGVQHGSRSATGMGRDPLSLLDESLPGWLAALRPGGAVGLAFNTRVASRRRLVELLTGHGLAVRDDAAVQGLEHRVDQAIVRDLVLARHA